MAYLMDCNYITYYQALLFSSSIAISSYLAQYKSNSESANLNI